MGEPCEQAAAVLAVSVVGQHVADHVAVGIDCQLQVVAEPAGLAGLDGDAGIRVHGRVVGFIRSVFGSLVGAART